MRYLILLLLVGCTSEPYWVKVREPIPVRSVIYVDAPCSRDILGCFNLQTQNIEIVRGMDSSLQWCVLNHERKHADGYGHLRNYGLSMDCGNGETL